MQNIVTVRLIFALGIHSSIPNLQIQKTFIPLHPLLGIAIRKRFFTINSSRKRAVRHEATKMRDHVVTYCRGTDTKVREYKLGHTPTHYNDTRILRLSQ